MTSLPAGAQHTIHLLSVPFYLVGELPRLVREIDRSGGGWCARRIVIRHAARKETGRATGGCEAREPGPAEEVVVHAGRPRWSCELSWAPLPSPSPMQFRVLIEQDEDGAFTAEVPSLPGCVSQGATRAEAVQNVREAVAAYLDSLKAHGEPIPPSIGEEIIDVPA